MPHVKIEPHIRWLIRRDMPEVMYMEERGSPSPWSEEDFLKCLRERNCIGMACEVKEEVYGYMVYELHKYSLHVLNFVVHPEHRRQGLGTAMVEKLKSKLSSHRRTRITADVRESSLGVQLFLREQSFKASKVTRGFFEDTGEASYFMEHVIPHTEGEE